MGAYAQQLKDERSQRLARLGMVSAPVVVDRRLIPRNRPISKVDPEIARAILAEEFMRNWPVAAPAGKPRFEWHCSLPKGVRSTPINSRNDHEPFAQATMPEICTVVCAEFEVTLTELRGASRRECVSLPRQVVMYLGYRAGLSTGRVGGYLGGRDHTTALHGRQKIAAMMKMDLEFAATVARLEAQISQ